MASVLLEAVLSKLPPHIRGIAAGYLPKLDNDPTIQAINSVVTSLAEKDNMPVGEFITSGRAIQVLGSLAIGQEIPPVKIGAEIEVHKCPKCNHIGYLVTQ